MADLMPCIGRGNDFISDTNSLCLEGNHETQDSTVNGNGVFAVNEGGKRRLKFLDLVPMTGSGRLQHL